MPLQLKSACKHTVLQVAALPLASSGRADSVATGIGQYPNASPARSKASCQDYHQSRRRKASKELCLLGLLGGRWPGSAKPTALLRANGLHGRQEPLGCCRRAIQGRQETPSWQQDEPAGHNPLDDGTIAVGSGYLLLHAIEECTTSSRG